MYLIENISNKIGFKIASYMNLDKEKEEIIIYGAFSLFQLLLSVFSVAIMGIIFNVLLESIIVCFSITILRKYSGGVHSTSPNRCIAIGTSISVLLAVVIRRFTCNFNVKLTIIIFLLAYLYSYYFVYKYAPVDSISKPIINIKTKNKLRKKSILVINFSIIISIILGGIYFKYNLRILFNIIQAMCFGIAWQAFTLTHIGFKLLNKLDSTIKRYLKI